MAIALAKEILSLEEFLALPETKPASEYIDGQIYQKPKILTFQNGCFINHQGMDRLPVLEVLRDWHLSVQDVFDLIKYHR